MASSLYFNIFNIYILELQLVLNLKILNLFMNAIFFISFVRSLNVSSNITITIK